MSDDKIELCDGTVTLSIKPKFRCKIHGDDVPYMAYKDLKSSDWQYYCSLCIRDFWEEKFGQLERIEEK